MTETELIENCKSGDGEAFRKLLNVYRKQLFGYLWRLGGSQYAAEELFQETTIKIWKGLKNYNGKNKFSSWIFTIAHNTAMDSFRKKKNNEIEIDENTLLVSNYTPDQNIVKNENNVLINRAIKNLNMKQKEVFLLRQHSGMKFKEIAKVTDQPLNTVLSHMNYAVKKLRKELEVINEH